ncbi:hypothetical protein LCGC14_1838930 [marine sediment metagenome]|uniref:Uncharacterized protein n=1 Tax=marine sediment metagenome TaxID=412755 RepID=A0A0F9GDY1_9ZZZZ
MKYSLAIIALMAFGCLILVFEFYALKVIDWAFDRDLK